MPVRRVSVHRALVSESRVALLRLLHEVDSPMSVDALAEAVELHVNTTREHLDRLISAGLVSRHPEVRCVRGRPKMLYSATARPEHAANETRVREEMARILVAGYGTAAESPTAAAERAGFEWGVRLSSEFDVPSVSARSRSATERVTGPQAEIVQLTALGAALGALGFEPESDPEALEVHLRRCPYHELTHECPKVMCSVLLGVSRGVLAQVGGPLTAAQLDPFVGPRPCVLYLERASRNPSRATR